MTPTEQTAEQGAIEVSEWFKQAQLCEIRGCCGDYRCPDCKPDGDCDPCRTIDGRWICAVSDYASTCDGCGELTMHEEMEMDEETQLGYCQQCQKEPALSSLVLELLENENG